MGYPINVIVNLVNSSGEIVNNVNCTWATIDLSYTNVWEKILTEWETNSVGILTNSIFKYKLTGQFIYWTSEEDKKIGTNGYNGMKIELMYDDIPNENPYKILYEKFKTMELETVTSRSPDGGVPPEEPATTEPETTEPETTEPAATEPAATEPETTEPETAEPAATEPATMEPETTEPAATEPETTEPETTEPATTESIL